MVGGWHGDLFVEALWGMICQILKSEQHHNNNNSDDDDDDADGTTTAC
jgi:fatty acid desaturase